MLSLLFLLSCLISYESHDDQAALTFESTGSDKVVFHKIPLKSSTKILSYNSTDFLGHGSGNYFKLGKYKFLITAAHVVSKTANHFALDGDELVSFDILYLDEINDIAVLRPHRDLKHIKPQSFRPNKAKDLDGETIYYAGYPSDIGKSIFKGFISKTVRGAIVMQSFALPGSSGSMVFDFWGRSIGVVSAVKVSSYGPTPQLAESIVIVRRVDFIDSKFIKEMFENAERSDP